MREDNYYSGKTYIWTYDKGGNILSKTEYAYTAGTLGEPLNTVNYSYGNSDWKDYTQHINVDRNTVRVFCLLLFS